MKKNYKYTIAIDIDGVLADFEGEFCDAFGYDNRHLVDLEERYPNVDKGLIKEFVQNSENYKDCLPIFGGILLVREARKYGFYPLLLTSRPKHLAEVTRNWLEDYEIHYEELWYSKNKASSIKIYNGMFPNRPIKMLVDDIASNLENLPSGVVGVAWEQPWNLYYTPSAHYNDESMELEIFEHSLTGWKPFWENNNEIKL